jgi:hypothetical protein
MLKQLKRKQECCCATCGKSVKAAERYRQFGATDVFPVRLPDAQYMVARHYGFKSWVALTAFLTSQTLVAINTSRPARRVSTPLRQVLTEFSDFFV